MQILVRRLGAATSAIDVGPDTTAGQLLESLVAGSNLRCFYLSHGGKLLRPESRMGESGIRDWETVEVGLRARGGGGDGGATGAESRDCYLKMYADRKPDKVDPNEARLARWTRCTLSSESLKPPFVMDPLGNIYNKEALVSALIAKSLPKRLRYIKGLKDLVDVELATIPGVDPSDDHVETKFQCPVTGQEFNGKFRFVALRNCGHVLSVRAFKEVKSTACLVCHKEFKEEDKVVVYGTGEEVAVLRGKMEASRAREKEKKKQKSEALEAENGAGKKRNGAVAENGKKRDAAGDSVVQQQQQQQQQCGVPIAAVVAAATAVKKAKLHVPDHATSEVYKSIFTSSGKSKDIRETYSCRALPIGRN